MEAHKRDIYQPEPVVLEQTETRDEITMDDVTNFPHQRIVPLMESRVYEEGKYRPPSMPAIGGIFPTNMYLYRGKSYDWCSCGHT